VACAIRAFQIFIANAGCKSVSSLFLLSALFVTSVGCGRNNFGTVEGIVSLDGKVLDGGSVSFSPVAEGPLSFGDIAPDGLYRLHTATIEGTVPGKYIATVSCRRGRPSPGMSISEVEALEKVPVRYCNKSTSDLRFDVKPGRNIFDLKLTSK
jgi:hypothetical protein